MIVDGHAHVSASDYGNVRVLLEQLDQAGIERALCVPGGPSVACSTPTAIKWDAAFAQMADPSGRAVKDVHKDSYK